MKEFIDFVKMHNVWLATVSRVVIGGVAAFGANLTGEQMAFLITLVEVVFGVGQAKVNVAEPRVDVIVSNRMADILTEPPAK